MNRSVVVIGGTRPELIKLAPVMRELEVRRIPNELLLTGQHADLVEGLSEFFGITQVSRINLIRKGSDLNGLLASLLEKLSLKVQVLNPALLLVQGDTTSALAGALTGMHLRIPVAHVEAGLRTGDRNNPFPEESNRRLIGQIAAMHFTPTRAATQNLLSEGISRSAIWEVGNTVVDATQFALARSSAARERTASSPYLTITVHRRESWEKELSSVLRAIQLLADRRKPFQFKLVMHANPTLQEAIRKQLGSIENVILLPPMRYPEFIDLLSGSFMILSDSGGIQEEAPTLGVPTVVLRQTTERPEALECGSCRLGGTSTMEIVRVVDQWWDEIIANEWKPVVANPFGDGKASKRIVDAICLHEFWLSED